MNPDHPEAHSSRCAAAPSDRSDPYNAIHAILQNLHQRITLVESNAATSQNLQTFIQNAIVQANTGTTTPASPARLNLPKITLQPFAVCEEKWQAGSFDNDLRDPSALQALLKLDLDPWHLGPSWHNISVSSSRVSDEGRRMRLARFRISHGNTMMPARQDAAFHSWALNWDGSLSKDSFPRIAPPVSEWHPRLGDIQRDRLTILDASFHGAKLLTSRPTRPPPPRAPHADAIDCAAEALAKDVCDTIAKCAGPTGPSIRGLLPSGMSFVPSRRQTSAFARRFRQ
ncbi:hypothetical protein BJY52DRAFT_1184906 [Lactarius psammicola]|nr:hypothetical protein BJY52DRAFT_1184906 [Lactarius psammicola]